ncbi:MAG: class I SAM-dependent methyltransferase [Candidatus Wallbacteria bacterium]|nr:class I SAM-dependent methyltransferase [Candidatus Wallbacteria bacterium]
MITSIFNLKELSMQQWNQIFKKDGKVFTKIQEDMPSLARLFKKSGLKRILDLGSGSGRHVVYLASKGFELHGLDIADSGHAISREWLKRKNLQAELAIGSIYEKFPYCDGFFDAVISTQVIHHQKIENIRKAINEIERVLRPGGFVFITVMKRNWFKLWPRMQMIKRRDRKLTDFKVIAERTFVFTEGGEKGLPHYIFNKDILKREFKSFDIQWIKVDSERRNYCLLARKKCL